MLIHVDPHRPVPIYQQIIQQIKNASAAGLIAPGDRLPSVRELSKEIGINPNTIARAYQELEREGAIEPLRGIGTFVCAAPIRLSEQERCGKILKILQDLFTEAYHLHYDKEELQTIIREAMERWQPGRGGE